MASARHIETPMLEQPPCRQFFGAATRWRRIIKNRLLFVAYTMRGTSAFASSRPGKPSPMDGNVTMITGKNDWRRFDALTDRKFMSDDRDPQPGEAHLTCERWDTEKHKPL
jgi:hypothetical protein